MNTVPQGTIDMNQSTDVVYADQLTGQKHAVCVMLTDQQFYMRGENREDIMGYAYHFIFKFIFC